jgi:hypothetical protein
MVHNESLVCLEQLRFAVAQLECRLVPVEGWNGLFVEPDGPVEVGDEPKVGFRLSRCLTNFHSTPSLDNRLVVVGTSLDKILVVLDFAVDLVGIAFLV